MAGKVRAVRTPPASLVQTGEMNKGYRFMSGSMGAATPPPPQDAAFEAAIELTPEEIRRREEAVGLPLEPESVPPASAINYGILANQLDAAEWNRGASSIPMRPRGWQSPDINLSSLPDRFTIEVERKGNVWVVRAPAVHQALFVADGDLVEALSQAPGRLAEIVNVDGIVPAKGRKK